MNLWETRLLIDIYERCNLVAFEPTNFNKATSDEQWKMAIEKEIAMIEKNATWKLVDRPKNKKVLIVKWIFKTKLNPDDFVNKYKARLVVKGYL